MRVADAQAGHAVRLRERSRDEDVRRLHRQRNRALVRRVGHVVVIRLVDEDDRVRGRGADRCTKSVTALLPCTVAVGLFGLLRNTRPAPLAAAAIAVEVEPERRVDLDLGHRMPEFLRELRAVLERRCGGHEAAGRRRERADRALEDLLRAGAEDDVLGLGAELRRDGGDERAVGRRAVERIASGLGELAHDRVERRLARAERILVAADADGLDARRQLRPGGAVAALRGLRLVLLVAARGNPEPGVMTRVRNALRPGRQENCGAIWRMRSSPSCRAVVTARILRLGPGGVKPARPRPGTRAGSRFVGLVSDTIAAQKPAARRRH